MKWLPHVRHISKRCFAVIASIARLRRTGMAVPLLVSIYKALLEPILSYCLPVWGSSYANVINAARIIQNDAIRAVTGRSRIESVADYYSKLNILSVDKLTDKSLSILAFKFRKGMVPAEGPFDICVRSAGPTRRRPSLRVPRPRSLLASHCLRHRLPSVWNGLSPSTKKASTIKTFKKKLRQRAS